MARARSRRRRAGCARASPRAVDDDRRVPLGVSDEPATAGREVLHVPRRVGCREPIAVDDKHVGRPSRCEDAPIGEAHGARRDRCEPRYGRFEAEHVGYPLGQQSGRVVGAAERQEVRAAVAAAGHHERGADHGLDRGAPLRVRRRGEHELGLQILVEGQVEEDVERVAAHLGSDLGHRAVEPRSVPVVAHGLDGQHGPHEDEGPARRVGDLAAHLFTHRGVAEAGVARDGGEGERVAEARHLVEEEGGAELEVGPLAVAGEHRVDRQAVADRRFGELEAPSPTVGGVGHHREGVQVHRPG